VKTGGPEGSLLTFILNQVVLFCKLSGKSCVVPTDRQVNLV
jgi:hypothetical protein